MSFPESPTPKRRGPNAGVTKETKPRLSNRLPREKGIIVSEAGDGMSMFDRALVVLGDRVTECKTSYLLDGKPCNATEIMRAAGIDV